MRLYSYWRSSSAYRVRIALNLKGLDYELVPVHLLRDGGEQLQADHLERNPQGMVPVLEHGARSFTQSLAIIEYLEEVSPEPPLLPAVPEERARVRALAYLIADDIQPINNLRVLKYLKHELGVDDAARNDWYVHWTLTGLAAFEKLLTSNAPSGKFCHGASPGLADVCLVPQVYNAERYRCDLAPYPKIRRITQHCRALEAFSRAAPENQLDAE
ncbi:MAG: maleylacetoacetate isomerase [Gammaproteobacteria bacterium]